MLSTASVAEDLRADDATYSGFVVVEPPQLADGINSDWGGLEAKDLEASLLSDLHQEQGLDAWHGYRDALVRLRFYYPATYAALRGEDLKKRAAFEADEKSPKNPE
ncbi:MAG: hypothetical protein JOZ13_12930 [Alphaproteobacteria bacterium]|nr:hypothetical protein [Alphaproteobacteria bacterium]